MDFKRIQFTPDLLPSDVVGTQILMDRDGRRELVFQRGPVFCNMLLADEINRATPKTQSALLETMQEKRVTVANQTHSLSLPFFVLATQNPIENDGTYPLPEAQLDRFFFKLQVGLPVARRVHADPRPHRRKLPPARQAGRPRRGHPPHGRARCARSRSPRTCRTTSCGSCAARTRK